MSIRQHPTDLKTLIGRMKNMLGHVGRRDRDVVNEVCEALVELAGRLHAVKTTGVDPGDLPPLEDREDYAPSPARHLADMTDGELDESARRLKTARLRGSREDETAITPGTRLDA